MGDRVWCGSIKYFICEYKKSPAREQGIVKDVGVICAACCDAYKCYMLKYILKEQIGALGDEARGNLASNLETQRKVYIDKCGRKSTASEELISMLQVKNIAELKQV